MIAVAKHSSQITDAITGRRQARQDIARVRREVKAVVARMDEAEADDMRRLITEEGEED